MWEGKPEQQEREEQEEETALDGARQNDEDEDDRDHDSGDDFDDFAEGGGDDDFGDFDEGEEGPAMEQPGPAVFSGHSDILAALVSSLSKCYPPLTGCSQTCVHGVS